MSAHMYVHKLVLIAVLVECREGNEMRFFTF